MPSAHISEFKARFPMLYDFSWAGGRLSLFFKSSRQYLLSPLTASIPSFGRDSANSPPPSADNKFFIEPKRAKCCWLTPVTSPILGLNIEQTSFTLPLLYAPT